MVAHCKMNKMNKIYYNVSVIMHSLVKFSRVAVISTLYSYPYYFDKNFTVIIGIAIMWIAQ